MYSRIFFYFVIIQIFLNFAFAQSKNISIELADKYFFQMDYDNAIEIYKTLSNQNPDDYEINWKLARVYVNYGEVPGNEKKDYFENSKKYAEKSIDVNPNCGGGYTFLAAAIGNLAFWGVNSQKINSNWQMITFLNKSLNINPNDDIALSIYGSLERMLANVSWIEKTVAGLIYQNSLPSGSYENSVKYFKKAISIDQLLIRHHYELALTYLDMKEYQKAKEEFHNALKCPIRLKADHRRIELINKHLNEIQ
jgi:tetratricopeptide (TPR) repeat protein